MLAARVTGNCAAGNRIQREESFSRVWQEKEKWNFKREGFPKSKFGNQKNNRTSAFILEIP